MNWSEINLNNWVLWLGLGIVALAILIWIYIRLHEKLPYELNETILTERERAFYRILKPIADKLELQICPKVRVADIVSIKKGTKDWQKWFNKIRSKHVDFLLCDYDMNIVLMTPSEILRLAGCTRHPDQADLLPCRQCTPPRGTLR